MPKIEEIEEPCLVECVHRDAGGICFFKNPQSGVVRSCSFNFHCVTRKGDLQLYRSNMK